MKNSEPKLVRLSGRTLVFCQQLQVIYLEYVNLRMFKLVFTGPFIAAPLISLRKLTRIFLENKVNDQDSEMVVIVDENLNDNTCFLLNMCRVRVDGQC